MRKERVRDILRVAKFIEGAPDTHLREIARGLKMNPAVVHRTLRDIGEFITAKSISDESIPLPNLPILVRLKQGVTAEGILRFLKVKNKLSDKNG